MKDQPGFYIIWAALCAVIAGVFVWAIRKKKQQERSPEFQRDLQVNLPSNEIGAVAEVKDMLRNAAGARDFVAKAQRAGFGTVKEDFLGLHLSRGDCNLILVILASRGPDSIWALSMTTGKGSGIVNLVDEGRLTF